MRQTFFLSAVLVTVTAGAQSPGVSSIGLPGGPPVGMDYLVYDPVSALLFVPASNTARLDIVDTRTGQVRSVDGWAIANRGERIAGITAAGAGGGFVYVGNRADSTICAVEIRTLARKGCTTVPSSPDGVFYVGVMKEVWVTTPRDAALRILSVRDPAAPVLIETVKLEGQPEGYAVDERRGVVFTNLEDKDRTLVIDARSRKVTATWNPECGEKGPRGIALDPESMRVFVACSTGGVREFAADGHVIGRLATGAGVDNIDWYPRGRLVYAASAEDAKLTVAKAGADGALSVVFTAPTASGARSVFVDGAGTAYLPDSKGGKLIVVKPSF